jgi:hypothetical protein
LYKEGAVSSEDLKGGEFEVHASVRACMCDSFPKADEKLVDLHKRSTDGAPRHPLEKRMTSPAL